MHLSYAIRLENGNGFSVFQLLINKKETKYFLVPIALEWSTKIDGIFPIVTCSCGIVGCGGAYVKVSRNKNEIIWEKLLHGTSCGKESDEYKEFPIIFKDKSEISLPIKFDKKEYEKTTKKLLNESVFEKYEKENYLYNLKYFKKGNFFIM